MNSKPTKVLITDGNQRPALAATRSLARHGFDVIIGEEKCQSLSGSSKYSKTNFVYPSPLFYSDEFVKAIRNECVSMGIDIVLPMTEISTHLILKEKTYFESIGSRAPFLDFSSFVGISDKINLLKLAKELNIPSPESHFIHKPEDVQGLRRELKFPAVLKAVLKPARSRIYLGDSWIPGGVRYANSFDQLEKICLEERVFRENSFILQQYIHGSGYGIFVLYDRGTPVTFFAHRRIRKKPPSGGVSVLCESIPVDPSLREYTKRLLSKVGWHGVAMVEFKRCQDTGLPYLMEVNGRFWGSLQLAIEAGVDFPYLLCQLALKREVSPPHTYRVGIKSRWLLGDLDNLYLTLFSNGALPFKVHARDKLKAIFEFLKLIQRNTYFDVLSLKDLSPFLFELWEYLKSLSNF